MEIKIPTISDLSPAIRRKIELFNSRPITGDRIQGWTYFEHRDDNPYSDRDLTDRAYDLDFGEK